MKNQIKIKKFKIMACVWIGLYCILIWSCVYGIWRYEWFSGVVNVLSSSNVFVKAIILASAYLCLAIVLTPGLIWYFSFYNLVYNGDKPAGPGCGAVIIIICFVFIVITVSIDIIGLIISKITGIIGFDIIGFMKSKIIAIGIGGVIILIGLISIIDRTLFRIIKSIRSKPEDS